MKGCITVDRWLEPSEADRRHVNECSDCAELARELDLVRAHAAELSPAGWGANPAPAVDVDAALASVFRQADFLPPARTKRPLFVQVATTLAAAALLFSVAAPSLLRWRVETSSRDQAVRSAPLSGVFWTSDRRP